MIPKVLIATICFPFILCLACQKEKVYCTETGAGVSFRGYDTTEVKQIIFTAFAADGTFTHAVDTFSLSAPYNTAAFAWQKGDTINYPKIPSGWDYIVTLLPIGKRWRLTEIRYQTGAYQTYPASHSKPELPCPIGSYIVDGTRVSYPATDNPGFSYILLQ